MIFYRYFLFAFTFVSFCEGSQPQFAVGVNTTPPQIPQLESARDVLVLLAQGRRDDARLAIRTLRSRSDKLVSAGMFAAFLKVPMFFEFFLSLPEYRFSSQQDFSTKMVRLATVPPVKDLLLSDCADLKAVWQRMTQRSYSTVSQVELMYVLKDLKTGLEAYLTAVREQAREAQNLAEREQVAAEQRRIREQQVREFERKTGSFYASPSFRNLGHCNLTLRRDYLFEDTFQKTQEMENPRCNVRIVFQGEPGIDATGLMREFFTQVTQKVIQNNIDYFIMVNGAYVINPATTIMMQGGAYEDQIDNIYRFFGRFLGLAILNKQCLPALFAPHFYKSLLEIPLTLQDMKAHDESVYNSYVYMLHNPVEGLDIPWALDITDIDGNSRSVELKPNGGSIDVTDQDKAEFVATANEFILLDCVKRQMELIRIGLFSVVSLNDLRMFLPHELNFLISGSPTIDAADWQNHVEYSGPVNHQIVEWFWDYVKNHLSDEERSKLLFYITGTSRPPVTGFKDLRPGFKFMFSVMLHSKSLFESHTCFNQLVVPPVCTKDELEFKIRKAVELSDAGYGLS